jgi:hypothetical protein
MNLRAFLKRLNSLLADHRKAIIKDQEIIVANRMNPGTITAAAANKRSSERFIYLVGYLADIMELVDEFQVSFDKETTKKNLLRQKAKKQDK